MEHNEVKRKDKNMGIQFSHSHRKWCARRDGHTLKRHT